MVSQVQADSQPTIEYPESDGKPMADNTQQFRWIVVIKENLESLFANDPNVFVAGDLLWYPIEGNDKICTAPDVMVVFGRLKGDRGCYQQWKEAAIPPQVVFEILSPSNTRREMNRKLLFYDRYGIEEYYLYDPKTNALKGWLRAEDFLDEIEEMADWQSPRLGIRFDLSGAELQIYRPDNTRFLSHTELIERLEQERQRAEQERQRADRFAQRLRQLGVNPDEI